jgi:hypothetical protein
MKVITIGKRLIAAAQIAFVEPFDPAANPDFKPEKDFKARIVLLNRDAVLTEDNPAAFAEAHVLHLFKEDDVAVNRAIAYKIESFGPSGSFNPSKHFKTRLKWTDASVADQSKLLVTAPETVIAELLETKAKAPTDKKRTARRPGRGRGRGAASRLEASQS